jgi:hypothetical protein
MLSITDAGGSGSVEKATCGTSSQRVFGRGHGLGLGEWLHGVDWLVSCDFGVNYLVLVFAIGASAVESILKRLGTWKD